MTQLFTNFADCTGGSFLGFPHWYKYLTCNNGVPDLTNIYNAWLIVAAVIEMLLYIAGIAAVIIIVVGGFQYMLSQGESDKTAKAQSTILNALIGLVIAVMAATAVNFVAGRFQ